MTNTPGESSPQEVTLWRAGADSNLYTGFRSFWAKERAYAEVWRDFLGFGGPTLYRAVVQPEWSSVLDRRHRPWDTVSRTFGLEQADYVREEPHETWAALAPMFQSAGCTWLVFCEGEPWQEEWINLANSLVTVSRVED